MIKTQQVMKVSHELPLGLFQYSYQWNDYDYMLPHLIDKYLHYEAYFRKAREDGRFIIMDNGLFEGVTHTEEDLIEKINLIKPDIFIVPDAWNDTEITLKNAKHWMEDIKPSLPLETNLMVVMQGEFLFDMLKLYVRCELIGYKHFSFNHSSILYQNMHRSPNKLINQMLGRWEVITNFLNRGVIKSNHYVHLLGASLPQEFTLYKDELYSSIKSVDTSNPIIVGALDQKYEDYGLLNKPTEKIEEFMEVDLSSKIEDIIFNVYKFKSYAK
jgi:hypothetical protein